MQIQFNFKLKSKNFCQAMIILNFTNKPSTKAIFALPIQIKLQKGPCIKSYLHNHPQIFTIGSFFKQNKHLMHKINAVLLCRHLGCHSDWGRPQVVIALSVRLEAASRLAYSPMFEYHVGVHAKMKRDWMFSSAGHSPRCP